MKWLFVADPLAALHPSGDSTLSLLRAALTKKIECHWTTSDEIGLESGHPSAHHRTVVECPEGQVPRLGEPSRTPVKNFRAVLIRKDPPFDSKYVRLCWILQLAEEKVCFVNRPSRLLLYHEKLIPFQAMHEGFLRANDIVPTFLNAAEAIVEFISSTRAEYLVTKPFFGHAGKGVARVGVGELNFRTGSDDLIQPFLREIADGDIRAFFLGGKFLAAFNRMPPPKGFVSNLAQGGSAVKAKLSAGQKHVLARLGKFLRAAKIDLAGADMIGERISEVNITSPTGLVTLLILEGRDFAEPIVDYIKRKTQTK